MQTTLHGRPPAVAVDFRRNLQLALAVLWLLDGVLQFQPAMFGPAFPKMLAAGAGGNPGFVAGPVIWSATLIAHHEAALNAAFAAVQVALGLGIAFRPTVKAALAASIAWSLSVWWLGEGLGGILTGAGLPAGAPGAVLLYAVLALVVWPVDPRLARLCWLAVWGTLALLAARTSTAPLDVPAGQPAWLTTLTTHAAGLLGHQPLIAAVLALIALGVYLPTRALRPLLVLALVVSAVLWLAQGLGGLLTGSATDPNSAPLLALLALFFWPRPEAAASFWPRPEAATR